MTSVCPDDIGKPSRMVSVCSVSVTILLLSKLQKGHVSVIVCGTCAGFVSRTPLCLDYTGRPSDVYSDYAEYEIDIITGKEASNHIPMLVAYCRTQNISKIMQWLKGILF